MSRGQIFTTRDNLVLIEDYHFGADVVYEYATQMWLDQAAQQAIAAALELSSMTNAQDLSQMLKDHFVTFRAARQFADQHNIPYKLTTDTQA